MIILLLAFSYQFQDEYNRNRGFLEVTFAFTFSPS